MPEIESEEMVSQLSGNTQTALAIIFLIWVTSTSCSTLMNKTVAPQRRKASAPGKCRIGGGALDESLTNRTRRARRLDNALEDARMNAGYSVFHTPRLARGQRLSKPRSDNATGDQLQDVYDRIEQRNNVSTLSPARIPTLSPTQLRSAEQAVQVFVDRMRHAADAADDQAKFALTRALANDLAAFGDNVSSRLAPPLATARQQNHEAHVVNELDDVACWYSLGKEIGRGTFGRVRVATHRLSGTPVAVKSYARLHGARSCLPVDAIGKRMIGDSAGDALEWRRVRQEVNVLSRLRAHPNVMRFVEVFETTSRIHVVTELVRGTSLCEVLRRASGQRLTETRAKRIFQQLLEAVEALHAQSVIHRDLKLENILLDEGSGHATVIDFGFSDFEESAEPQTPDPADNNPPKKRSKKKNFCGTPSYMAPEVVASERYDGRPVDVWSLGVLLYVMLCGKFPFQGVSFHQLYQKLRSGAQQLVLPTTLSSEARTLLQSVLTVDPAKRPRASELQCCSWLQCLESPQISSPLLENVMKLSFEAWPGIHQIVCTALTELYGVQLIPLGLKQTKAASRRCSRLSSFLELATTESSHDFQNIIDAASSLQSPEDLQHKEKDIESSDSERSPNDVEAASTRHKQQLEKLIGLVKTSLATS